MQSPVHHHVPRHELLDGQLFHSEGGGYLHFGVVRNECRGNVSRIHRIAKSPAHGRMVIAIVPNRPIADVSAIAIAGITASQILAPHLLQHVSTNGGGISQFGRRDMLDRVHQHRVSLRQ